MDAEIIEMGQSHSYGQSEAMLDVLGWDMVTSAFEDIPQTVIVLIVIISFDQFTTISFLSVSLSISLILSKLVRLAFVSIVTGEDNSMHWTTVVLQYKNTGNEHGGHSFQQIDLGVRTPTKEQITHQ